MSGNTIKVKPEQLAAAIRKELESYSKAATEETKELIRETAKSARKKFKARHLSERANIARAGL